jgi:hypothetical protein
VGLGTREGPADKRFAEQNFAPLAAVGAHLVDRAFSRRQQLLGSNAVLDALHRNLGYFGPGDIREVSRITFDKKQKPHWIAADADNRRIVLNSGEYGEHRLFMLNFDSQTGALAIDERFRDAGSKEAGVSMDGKSWPHGFKGNSYPHGTVFSRAGATVGSASTGK